MSLEEIIRLLLRVLHDALDEEKLKFNFPTKSLLSRTRFKFHRCWCWRWKWIMFHIQRNLQNVHKLEESPSSSHEVLSLLTQQNTKISTTFFLPFFFALPCECCWKHKYYLKHNFILLHSKTLNETWNTIWVGILNVHFGILSLRVRTNAEEKKGKENKFLMCFIFEDFIALSATLERGMSELNVNRKTRLE